MTHSGDRELGADVGVARSKAKPSRAFANRTVSTSADLDRFCVVAVEAGLEVVEVDEVVGVVAPDVDVDVEEVGADGVVLVARDRVAPAVTRAGGAGIETNRTAPSVERTKAAHDPDAHGAVPRIHSSLGVACE